MSENQNLDDIIRRADQVKPEDRRRYGDIREMRADIAARSERPKLSDARGAFPDFTGGLSAEEYLDRQRTPHRVQERIEKLEAELREARAAVETQRKVADAYLEALQDEYRPHVEQNKAFGLVIDAQAEEIEQLRATIERVRTAITLPELRSYADASKLHGSQLVVSAVRAALDGEQ